jgi:prepilin-type processing-associated H-X9-DG protein
MAWEEIPLAADPMLERLAAEFCRVESPSQLIHGDLLGNVLFADGEPPTIIDWAPYWRPSALGAAIAVVDAVCWHGVPVESVPSLGRGVTEWEQLLVRALTFRMATLHLLGIWDRALAERHDPVVRAIVALAAG